MKRMLALVFLLFMGKQALASCSGPVTNASFGTSFYQAQTVTGFIYDTDWSKMFVIVPGNTYITYLNVPLQVGYGFASTSYQPKTAPDTFYAYQIKNIYHASLETSDCISIVTNSGVYIVVK